MLDALGGWLTRFPRTVVFGVMALALTIGAGVLRLHFITDYRAYFDPRSQDFKQLADLESRFGPTDDILLAWMPASGKATSPPGMARVAELADGLRDTPFAGRVDSVADVPVSVGAAESAELATLRALSASDTPVDPAQWEQAVDQAAKITTGTILAPDRSIAAAHVTLNTPVPATFGDSKSVNDYVLALRDRVEKEAGAEGKVILAGVLPYYHSIMELAVRDIGLLIPICLLCAIGILRSLLASWRATFACCIPVVASVMTATGAHGWIGYPVTVATLVVPIMVLVISLAYVVHFADTYLHARHDMGAAEAARLSLRENLLPLTLTTITTLLGFLALNLSVSPPYRQMGTSTLIGVAAAASYSILMMPALLSWMDPPYWRDKGPLRRGLDWLSQAITRPSQSPALWIAVCLVIVGLLACIPLNRIDDNISQWFADSSRLRQENKIVDARLTGMQQLYYELPSGHEGGVHDPAYLARVERFVTWLRQQPRVAAVRSLPDFIRGVGRSFGAQGDVLPSDAAQVEQLLLSYQFSAPPGDRAMGLVDDTHSSSLVHVSAHNSTGQDFQDLDRRAQEWLRQNLPELKVQPGTSAVMMFSKMAHENIPPMVIGTLSVLTVAGLIVFLGLRSWRLGLITLIPALLPAALAFGVWGLISGHFGIALSVVTDAALGIIVDDCIHVLGRYHSARKRRGMDAAAACQYTIGHVGGAITTTTLVLSVGVGLLAFSSVQPTHEMGMVMPIIFVFAWFSVLVLLPQILMRLDR